MSSSSTFNGPVFILGMPRSGTKLLRNLLTAHSKVGIAGVETEFFPYLANNISKYGDLSNPKNFSLFYRDALAFPYFTYKKNPDEVVSEEIWFQLCESYTAAGIFEALIRIDTGISPATDAIWGDKSPSYISKVPLLAQHFPSARFILIVRDARDYCLSINNTWGKNTKRAAQRWADSMLTASEELKSPEIISVTIKYEELIEQPTATMRDICHFLGLDFEPKMLELDKPVESLGSLAATTSIIVTNKNKFLSSMSDLERRSIEMIAKEALDLYGYSIQYEGPPIRASKLTMMLYKITDGINLVARKARKKGLLNSIKFYSKYHQISGNRK